MERGLNPCYERLEPYLPPGGLAVELGCGVGHGVLHLLEKGFRVFANDADPEAIAITRSRLPPGAEVELLCAPYERLRLPPCDLVCAVFSLFFLKPEDFDPFWRSVVEALKPGGVFLGQFLGVNDGWSDRGYTLHTAEQVRSLFDGFEILSWEEVDRDGETIHQKPKHWHVFHVVAKKRAWPEQGDRLDAAHPGSGDP